MKRGCASPCTWCAAARSPIASNQHWIRHYCETLPAHEAHPGARSRGFNPWHTVEGIGSLRDLPNLWCDMAAVGDVGACEAIIETLGHERLLYGTDFPVSHLRGRCVAIGDGFLWLYDDTLDWSTVWFLPLQPVLIGLESLRVLKQAAWHRRLSDRQVEDMFCNNARRILSMMTSPPDPLSCDRYVVTGEGGWGVRSSTSALPGTPGDKNDCRQGEGE